ncbi:dicarboxylate transporter/tellurite-resistance protein TehA [Paraburkholderia sp. C35]|uniref:dicarboxylate transporter/tellurite-resistance protein TehA n=1 Tax=Paraburkholderia sp. C35 TaxID=2126993 RepID=UPI000D69477F|nr:dicarboxylate transporter/tellurite-resistance protein TehA [Paraburkholderia sp. C35]
MQSKTNDTVMPASFFGIAVGALALANAWRVAARIWTVPSEIVDVLTIGALVVWAIVLVSYARKWLLQREQAQAEWQHPVQSSFIALGATSSLLAAMALANYSHTAGLVVFVVSTVVQLAVGVHLQGRIWQGGRNPELTTPAIYLPAVAPSFVAATAAASFGWTQIGMLFFGAGVLSWLATESGVLHRAAVHTPLPEALRPLLGIQVAPPVVGGVAYMSITHGVPDLFAFVLLGYGLYQALMMVRLLPWIRRQGFVPSYWAFTFGAAAMPTLAMRMVERGATGEIEWLAVGLFVVANGVILMIAALTVRVWVAGKLMPKVELPLRVARG